MKVMVSHAGHVQANCAEAFRKYAPEAEYVDTAADDHAYGDEIAKRWNLGSDLVIFEHDNEITAEVLPSFAGCPEPWCTYAYEIFAPPWTRLVETAIGCVKFSARLQQELSWRDDVLDGLCPECNVTHDYHWGMLDARISVILIMHKGLQPHVHGEVRHYHPYLAVDPEAGAKGALDFEGGFKHVGG